MLLREFLELLKLWRAVFAQERSWERAVQVGLGLLCGLGQRTITRSIFVRGREQEDWTADYKLFSRSQWKSEELFQPVFTQAIPAYCAEGPLAFALDDTALPRTGKKIRTAFRQRDPKSPPFHPNLVWAQRFMQASLLVPLYQRDQKSSPRALPVRFKEAPVPKKPGRKATEDELKEYRQLRKKMNLSAAFVETVQELRARLDAAGHADRLLIAVGDGSFCNKTTFNAEYERTVLLTRCRKDLRLVQSHGGRLKDVQPEQVLRNKKRPWKMARIFYAGDWRNIEYKEIKNLSWPRLGSTRAVRLLVVKPLPYQRSKNSPREYREEAYLLCTDPRELPAELLLQKYFDRWEIEVNHRDEKTILGVGHAQVRNGQSVQKVPEMMVAMYSLLLLAGLNAMGTKRTSDYKPLPKWRKRAKRASCLDLLTLLRKESQNLDDPLVPIADYQAMTLTAAA